MTTPTDTMPDMAENIAILTKFQADNAEKPYLIVPHVDFELLLRYAAREAALMAALNKIYEIAQDRYEIALPLDKTGAKKIMDIAAKAQAQAQTKGGKDG